MLNVSSEPVRSLILSSSLWPQSHLVLLKTELRFAKIRETRGDEMRGYKNKPREKSTINENYAF